jgi:ADP-heptose:LPS heptosyltransferase
LLRLRRELVSRNFDFGVSARWDPRDHLTLKLSGARERIGFARLKSSRYLTRTLARPAPLAHRYESWRVVAAALGLELPPREKVDGGLYSRQHRPPVLLVHSGARLPLRVWPLENFREIVARLRRMNIQVQIACDADQVDWWRSRGENAACPRSVTELFALLDQAGTFFGNDSGPGHIAAACGLPTFTVFGPQLPEWFAPLHPDSEVVEGKACPYKPCSDYCRFPEPFCLHGNTVAEVWPRLEAFAARHLSPSSQPPTSSSQPPASNS